jgi:hypothetical protein
MGPKEELDNISLNQEQFEEFYENFGSQNFQLQSKVLEEVGTRQIDIYFKSIGFATTVIATIGLIAGFGFTALGYVDSPCFFFIGEALLIGGIFYGLFWIQQTYQGEYKSMEAESKKLRAFYETRNAKFMELYNSWISTHNISRATLTELNSIDMGSINLFKTDRETPVRHIYPQAMYVLMIIGTLMLLGSFF